LLEVFGEDYELHVWIPRSTIDTIIQNTANEEDRALQSNTWDRKRFSSREKFESWYNDKGRYVFSLIESDGNIAGIWFSRPSDAPELSQIDNVELANLIEQNKTKIHTGWVRIYPNARGKWLATPLIARSSYYYRHLYPDAYMSIDIDVANIPSQKAYQRVGYQYVWLGENKKTIEKNPHTRLVYIELP
jgi:RimJ/RimL family protein N-acetyltransferase